MIERFDLPPILTDRIRCVAVETTGGNTGAIEVGAYGGPRDP